LTSIKSYKSVSKINGVLRYFKRYCAKKHFHSPPSPYADLQSFGAKLSASNWLKAYFVIWLLRPAKCLGSVFKSWKSNGASSMPRTLPPDGLRSSYRWSRWYIAPTAPAEPPPKTTVGGLSLSPRPLVSIKCLNKALITLRPLKYLPNNFSALSGPPT